MAGAAYRAGEKLYDKRLDKDHDFTNKPDVVFKKTLLPDGADEKFLNREFLWNSVEQMEKRKDSQVAKDFVLALPKELSFENQVDLTLRFAETYFVAQGVVVDVAIHDHGAGNPHAHLYVTTRRLLGNTFDRYKARDLNPSFANGPGHKGFISEKDAWNKTWEGFQNEFFKEKNLALTVDPLCAIPQRHEGRIQTDPQHYLREENIAIKAANREIALNDPRVLLTLLSQQDSVFSEHAMIRLLAKHLGVNRPTSQADAALEFQSTLAKLKAHPHLFQLGPGDNGQNYYTTRINLLHEIQLEKYAKRMASKTGFSVPHNTLKSTLKQSTLTEEQRNALLHITRPTRLACLVGHAGTGKSYLLKAAQQIWHSQGYRVLGVAPTGIAAQNLSDSSQIPSRTLASLRLGLQRGTLSLSSNDIVVVDEAGMVNLSDWHTLTKSLYRAGAKLVTVGDPAQLQPIGPSGAWRMLLEQIGFAELTHVRRQHQPGDRKASRQLARGNVQAALRHYQSQHALHFKHNGKDTQLALINHWRETLQSDPTQLAQMAIVAHRNRDVEQLNQLAREQAIQLELVNPKKTLTMLATDKVAMNQQATSNSHQERKITKPLTLCLGERIVFLKNDRKLGVYNGQFATITNIGGHHITAKLDQGEQITVDTKCYQDIAYGYAATVHKFQGSTVDNTVWAYIDGQYWDRHLTYTAFTRHKTAFHGYINKQCFNNFDSLCRTLSQEGLKDSVLQWPLCYAMRRGFQPDSLVGRCLNYVGEKINAVKDSWHTLFQKQQQREQSSQDKKPNHCSWLLNHPDEWERLSKAPHKKLQWLSRYQKIYLDTIERKQPVNAIEKSIDELLQKIKIDPKIHTALIQSAPKIAQHIPAQTQSQEKILDLGNPRYQHEIEKLKDCPISKLRGYAKYYHLLQTKPQAEHAKITQSMKPLIQSIQSSEKAMDYLQQHGPKLAALVRSMTKERDKNRGRDR